MCHDCAVIVPFRLPSRRLPIPPHSSSRLTRPRAVRPDAVPSPELSPPSTSPSLSSVAALPSVRVATLSLPSPPIAFPLPSPFLSRCPSTVAFLSLRLSSPVALPLPSLSSPAALPSLPPPFLLSRCPSSPVAFLSRRPSFSPAALPSLPSPFSPVALPLSRRPFFLPSPILSPVTRLLSRRPSPPVFLSSVALHLSRPIIHLGIAHCIHPVHHRPRRLHSCYVMPSLRPSSLPSQSVFPPRLPFLSPLPSCRSSLPSHPVVPPLYPPIPSFLSPLPSRCSSSLPSYPVVLPPSPPILSFPLSPLLSRRPPCPQSLLFGVDQSTVSTPFLFSYIIHFFISIFFA
ncbi:unnamed protein product [Closterium sp. Naga37s-1]|nr:unnamed protein product [Closterium sp. Naga37s-1]